MGLSSPGGLSRAGLIPGSFSFIARCPYLDEHICIYLGLSLANLIPKTNLVPKQLNFFFFSTVLGTKFTLETKLVSLKKS